jgi:hypothetical protein
MKDNKEIYMERAERLDYIIPTFDPANGDMILVYRTEDGSGGRSFRLSPELGATFRDYLFRAVRERAN